MDAETTRELIRLIKEHPCSAIEVASGTIQVAFGSRRLVVMSAWRLIRESGIVLASDSSVAGSEIARGLLLGQRALAVMVQGAFNDLEIGFENGSLIQTFADSEKYEHWSFFGAPNEMIVAGPGQLWSRWEPT